MGLQIRINSQISRLSILLVAGLSMLCPPLLLADSDSTSFTPFEYEVPLKGTGAGSLSVTAQIGSVTGDFLVDTGASMVTIEKDLFDELRRMGSLLKVRSVAARLANGRVQALDVYMVEHFFLGSDCDLGPIEVAVVPRGGRNLLGMNALNQAAPFGFSIEPPALGLSRCSSQTLVSSVQQ